MRRFLSIALVLVGAASPSFAQAPETLWPAGGITTSMGSHHPVAPDGRRFRCFGLQTRPGERYTVSLYSDAFAPVLRAGRGADCTSLSKPIEDRREGSERAATVEIAGDGERWSISAGALASETGAFHLQVDRTVTVPATPVPIEIGQPLRSRLTPDDAVTAQHRTYDCYAFRAVRGDDLIATMRSTAFKPALQLYASPDCQGKSINSMNNWSEEAATLTESIANTEVYSIRAQSMQRGSFGPYSVTLSRGGRD